LGGAGAALQQRHDLALERIELARCATQRRRLAPGRVPAGPAPGKGACDRRSAQPAPTADAPPPMAADPFSNAGRWRHRHSVIWHLRPPRRSVRWPRAIEWRWAGDNRTAGNPWPNDRCCRRAGGAAASCRAASGRAFGLGSWPVRALALVGSQWAMEGPLGAGDISGVGAARVDSVTAAGTRSHINSQRGGRVACGEDRGGGVKPVSAAALGVGRHDGSTARVAAVARAPSLSGSAVVSGGQLEVSGVWAGRPTLGGAGMAVSGAAAVVPAAFANQV